MKSLQSLQTRVSKWFGTGTARPRYCRRSHRGRQLTLESLESRRLLSIDSINMGDPSSTLTIDSNDGLTDIAVSSNGTYVTVREWTVTHILDGRDAPPFNVLAQPEWVRFLRINGGSAKDIIDISGVIKGTALSEKTAIIGIH